MTTPYFFFIKFNNKLECFYFRLGFVNVRISPIIIKKIVEKFFVLALQGLDRGRIDPFFMITGAISIFN